MLITFFLYSAFEHLQQVRNSKNSVILCLLKISTNLGFCIVVSSHNRPVKNFHMWHFTLLLDNLQRAQELLLSLKLSALKLNLVYTFQKNDLLKCLKCISTC